MTKSAPTECPICGSSKISASNFDEVDNFEASRIVSCNNCDYEWWEVYVFSFTEEGG